MTNLSSLKRRPTRFHLWVGALATVMVAGMVGGAIVFQRGLIVTNLTDLVPWGLWITVDLSAIALSAGAFSLCAGVYLLGLHQYRAVARTATFIGLIGYSMAVTMLLLDIGRPDRFWHPAVFWNPHSVLWEVTMCVMLYMSVLALETAPIIGGSAWFRSRWPKVAAKLHAIHNLSPYLAVAGLGLSMLHQSSLGAAYGVLKARPIWYRPGISVLFIVSAMAGGIALTVLASMLANRISRRAKVDDRLLDEVAKFVGWILVAYLYFRFWDAFAMTYTHQPGRDEGLALLTQGQLSFNFWIGEILLGALVPAVLLLAKRLRRLPWVRMLALAFVVGGVVAYRWDTTIVGQLVVLSYLPNALNTAYATYTPSLIEYVTSSAVLAYGLLAFTIGVRYFGVVDHSEDEEMVHETSAWPATAGAD
ncbi:MAG: NrfD/PsrC family molybdoenzyme membrane anchor subunit [Anaerolineales bacterium]